MLEHLVGTTAYVLISDPFELGEELGWPAIECVIIAVRATEREESLLLRLRSPFTYKETHCEYLVASPRHHGSSYTQLAPGHDVFSGMTRTPAERAQGPDPCDVSWWRGGLAIIGNVSLDP